MRPDSAEFSNNWFRTNMRHCRKALLLILLGSMAALIAAYVAEYAFGLKPCPLCLYQRIPYAVAVILCGIGLYWRRKAWLLRSLLFLSLIALLTGSGLAFYHVGVEQGIFKGLEGCTTILPEGELTIEQLREQILEATDAARCDKPEFIFLGVSMAGWNVVYSFMLFLLAAVMWIRGGRGK